MAGIEGKKKRQGRKEQATSKISREIFPSEDRYCGSSKLEVERIGKRKNGPVLGSMVA